MAYHEQYKNICKYIDIYKIIDKDDEINNLPLEKTIEFLKLYWTLYIKDNNIYNYTENYILRFAFNKITNNTNEFFETFIKHPQLQDYTYTENILKTHKSVQLTKEHDYNKMKILLTVKNGLMNIHQNFETIKNSSYIPHFLLCDNNNLYDCSIDNELFKKICGIQYFNAELPFDWLVGISNIKGVTTEFIEKNYNVSINDNNNDNNDNNNNIEKYYLSYNDKDNFVKFCESNENPVDCLKNIIDNNINYTLYVCKQNKDVYIAPKSEICNYIIMYAVNDNFKNNIYCYKNQLIKILMSQSNLQPLKNICDVTLIKPIIDYFVYNQQIDKLLHLLDYHFNIRNICETLELIFSDIHGIDINLSKVSNYFDDINNYENFIKSHTFKKLCAANNVILNIKDVLLYNSSLEIYNNKFNVKLPNLNNINKYNGTIFCNDPVNVKILSLPIKDFIYDSILIGQVNVAIYLLQSESNNIDIKWKYFTNAIIRLGNIDLLKIWLDICKNNNVPIQYNTRSIENALVNQNTEFLDYFVKNIDLLAYDPLIISNLILNKKMLSIKWWMDNKLEYTISKKAHENIINNNEIKQLIVV